MNTSFGVILDRLIDEHLHGPSVPSNSSDPWVMVNEFSDLDAKDPRWFELFVHFYISENEENDDLLFFVRSLPSSEVNVDNSFSDINTEPIFVRRKVLNQLPVLTDAVCWKQTLFLNLIVHTSCVLTVAACKKKTLDNEDILKLDGKRAPNKTNMIALHRIIKKVYAAPYKSRMDVKDAFMNECSYPFIFYTVNDYESQDLHLKIHENEYLCVELSVLCLKDSSAGLSSKPQPTASSTTTKQHSASLSIDTNVPLSFQSIKSPIDKLASISIEEDASPFPTLSEYSKVVLFKGAVPFSSLLEVYQQKSSTSFLGSSFLKSASSLQPTKYILMRGPEGKGQCQVAINNQEEQSPIQAKTFSEKMSELGKSVIQQVAGKSEEKVITELECSMTYVNVNWQSIITDVMKYAETRRA